MANVTLQPLLPECQDKKITLKPSDFNVKDALHFHPDEWSYYEDTIPSAIPGIVLGALSLLGLLFIIIWSIIKICPCTRCCCRPKPEVPTEKITEVSKTRSIVGDPLQRNALTNASSAKQLDKNTRRCGDWNLLKIFYLFILLLGLAVIGVAGWGIAVSLQNTTQFSQFWSLVDKVQAKVDQTVTALNNLNGNLTEYANSSDLVHSDYQSIRTSLNATNPDAVAPLDALESSHQTIISAQQKLKESGQEVNDYLQGSMNSLNDLRPPTLEVEQTYRPIVIAILFGFVILSAIPATLLTIWKPRPVWAAVAVGVLWFFTMLLMLLGLGVFNSLRVVGDDTCLYSETFVLHSAADQVDDPAKSVWLTKVLTHYINATAPVANEVDTQGQELIAGTNLQTLNGTFNVSNLNSFSTVGENPGNLTAAQIVALQNIATLAPTLVTGIQDLVGVVDRSNAFPLYLETKVFMCCDISSSVSAVFTVWTIEGVLSFVLALACTFEIVRQTRGGKKQVDTELHDVSGEEELIFPPHAD